MNWKVLDSEESLEQLLDSSHQKAVAIFKHSTRCPVSFAAKKRVELEWDAVSEVDIYYLDLIEYRNISNKIAEDLGVTHQSPQLILIKDGKAIHNASHLSISAQKVASYI